MRKVVCVEQQRPFIPNRWFSDPVSVFYFLVKYLLTNLDPTVVNQLLLVQSSVLLSAANIQLRHVSYLQHTLLLGV